MRREGRSYKARPAEYPNADSLSKLSLFKTQNEKKQTNTASDAFVLEVPNGYVDEEDIDADHVLVGREATAAE